MDKKNLLTIKEFARLCQTTDRTIRFYDKVGLLKPVYVDEWTKYRYYSMYQTREFFKIRLFQDFHVQLKEIKESLPKATKHTFLQKQLDRLKIQIEEKQKVYRFLMTIRQFLFSGKPVKEFFKREVFGPYLLFCMYTPDGRYDRIEADIIHLMGVAKKLKIPITDKQLVLYLDYESYKPKDVRFEITLICSAKQNSKKIKNISLPEGYYFKEYPKTPVKAYTYKGPYEYITLIYQKIYEKPEVRKLKPHEVGLDMHIYGPWNAKSPFDYVTKIAFPIS